MSETPDAIGFSPPPARPVEHGNGVHEERRGQQRPFRVKLRGSVLTLLRLPNRREVRGKLHQLSTTGGLVNLDRTLEEKLEVELIFHLGEVTVREKAQMMFPMWATQGWLQPFRFLDLPEASKNELEKNLLQFVQTMQQPQSRGAANSQ